MNSFQRLALAAAVAGMPILAFAADAPFEPIRKVLQSPRCQNCHPKGDAPLQRDDGRTHGQYITRDIERVGMACATCHQTETMPGLRMPPGAPNWNLPPKEIPMVFEGKTPRELCEQLKDPKKNGGKDLPALLHHVEDDDLVLYGWNPGEGRTLPPLTHEVFAKAFRTWVEAGAPCPAS